MEAGGENEPCRGEEREVFARILGTGDHGACARGKIADEAAVLSFKHGDEDGGHVLDFFIMEFDFEPTT